MRVQIKRRGNSASVRIPAAVLAPAALRLDQGVDVREEGGRMVIEPVKRRVFDLDALLKEMDPSTFHDEKDFGAPVGNEIW